MYEEKYKTSLKFIFRREKKVKMTKKLLSLILSCVMLASAAVFTASATTGGPEYKYDTFVDHDNGTATITVSIKGGTYGVGRCALVYDNEVYDLLTSDGDVYNAGTDMIANVVIGAEVENEYKITTTEETNLTTDLLDTTNGLILFAWYANTRIVDGKDAGYINADDEYKTVATINLALAAGKTSSDVLKSDNIAGPADDSELGSKPGGYEGGSSAGDDNANNQNSTNESSGVSSNMPEAVLNENMTAVSVNASASGTNVTISWNRMTNEAAANVGKYVVEVIDSNGNIVSGATKEVVANGSETYSVSFTNANGLTTGKNYTVRVTPYRKSGFEGIPGEATFSTKVSTGGGGSSSSGGASVGASGAGLVYTVTFVAGDGTIPEGQKYKYEVNRNGYVAGSPKVIAPEGKVFAGWSVDGVTLVSIEVYKITKDTAFKAIYVDREEDTHRPFILGYPGGNVNADNYLTRAEAATIIARASGKFDETKDYTTMYFSDVAPEHWAYKYISFVYENNIVNGYENGTYAPDSNITRAEFATIMQRYLGLELHEEMTFVDVTKDNWAVAYIGACKYAGLINGYENGEFRPANNITRAEAVKILNRATDRIPTANAIDAYVAEKGVPFEDLAKDKWYYYEIMEAAFPHLISYYH